MLLLDLYRKAALLSPLSRPKVANVPRFGEKMAASGQLLCGLETYGKYSENLAKNKNIF